VTLALLCSGQGQLSPDALALCGAEPAAAPILRHARELLGRDPAELLSSPDRSANRASQILTVAAGLALHACLAGDLPRRRVIAGYSVGEMTAWSAAGLWPPAIALDLTARRAELMTEADPADAGLAYIRGLGRQAAEQAARDHRCEVAIVSAGDLVIVGGLRTDLAGLCADVRRAGARADLLDVRIASHTRRLAAATPPFAAALAQAALSATQPDVVLLSGADGSPLFSPARALDGLARQLAHPLDWQAVLDALAERGVRAVLELGPGDALARMASDYRPDWAVRAASDFRSLRGLRDWLAAIRPDGSQPFR
jgi:[acyl-carrier-protein] S-malonyltransferase